MLVAPVKPPGRYPGLRSSPVMPRQTALSGAQRDDAVRERAQTRRSDETRRCGKPENQQTSGATAKETAFRLVMDLRHLGVWLCARLELAPRLA